MEEKVPQSRLINCLTDLIYGAHRRVSDIKDGEAVIHQGEGFGSLTNDTEIKADKLVGEWSLNQVLSWELSIDQRIARVSVEGLEDQRIRSDGLWVCIDPLDGSLDYQTRGRHNTPFPYSFVVTVLKRSHEATFGDVIAAALIDLRPGRDIWIAEKQADGSFLTTFNGGPAKPLVHTKLELGKMILLGESYYPENRGLLYHGLRGMKGYLRSLGSAALEMAYVSSGLAAGYICHTQKQHELGAAYAFAKGSGAWISDFDGQPLDGVPFQFNVQTPVIIACTERLAFHLRNLMAIGKEDLRDEELARHRRDFYRD